MTEKNGKILEITDLVKTYALGTPNEVHALRGINLEVHKGEMLAIMGPSGCGKTTLLNMIGMLDRYTAGHVMLEGVDIAKLTDKQMADTRRDRIGFIFQLFNLFEFLTAIQNVMVPLLLQRLSASEARRRATMILREVGLGGRLNHRPGELSGGQQQRVAIARSLVTEPALILGDEPTGDLDTATSEDIMLLFRRINQEKNQTLLLVTHSPWIASKCDAIVHLGDGVVSKDTRLEVA
ncbi:MAG: ABC transporter ATP-binding protein [Candidatus Hodarchaeales archaeon]|jgi:putative ABC transport system ATP-binding protein